MLDKKGPKLSGNLVQLVQADELYRKAKDQVQEQ